MVYRIGQKSGLQEGDQHTGMLLVSVSCICIVPQNPSSFNDAFYHFYDGIAQMHHEGYVPGEPSG